MIMVLFTHCLAEQQVVSTYLFTNPEWMNENQRMLSIFK